MSRCVFRQTAIGAIAALAFGNGLIAHSACAQSLEQQWDYCKNNDHAHTPALQAGGCTAIIQSGRESQRNLAIAFRNRGDAYAQMGPPDFRVIADYTQAIALNPQDVFAFSGRARAYEVQGDIDRAIADYSRAIQLDPHGWTFFNRASAYHDQRDYERAIADWDQVIRLQPYDDAAWRHRCQARAEWGHELDDALADCNKSLRLRENMFYTLNSRGLVYFRRGEWEAAFADFNAAWSGNAHLIGALYGRGVARLRLGQTAEGHADIAAATARDAGIAATYADFGVAP